MINVVMKEHFKIMEVTKPNQFFAFFFKLVASTSLPQTLENVDLLLTTGNIIFDLTLTLGNTCILTNSWEYNID